MRSQRTNMMKLVTPERQKKKIYGSGDGKQLVQGMAECKCGAYGDDRADFKCVQERLQRLLECSSAGSKPAGALGEGSSSCVMQG